MSRVPASLRALLSNLIDYAGLYPPAALPLPLVVDRYRGFRASGEAWVLNRLVLPFDKLAEADVDASCRVTLLAEADPGPLPASVETLETKNLGLVSALPVYYEGPVGRPNAKVRTGGLTADAIPSAGQLAGFLRDAAVARIPFKATAGLHHAIRSERPLTYAADSPRATMHGFLNVFTAAAFAWHGADVPTLTEVLEERDPGAFRFDDAGFVWRTERLTTLQLQDARRDFAHSFGSCSFDEPVSELRELGLLP